MTEQQRKKRLQMRRKDLWFESAQRGDVESLCKLFENEHVSHVDIKDKNHCTALHLAATYGNEACLLTLMELGADPNRQV